MNLICWKNLSAANYRMMNTLIEKGSLPGFAASMKSPSAGWNDRTRIPVPQESLVFDDLPSPDPPLTTVHAPTYEMGHYGAQILHQFKDPKNGCAMKIKLPAIWNGNLLIRIPFLEETTMNRNIMSISLQQI